MSSFICFLIARASECTFSLKRSPEIASDAFTGGFSKGSANCCRDVERFYFDIVVFLLYCCFSSTGSLNS